MSLWDEIKNIANNIKDAFEENDESNQNKNLSLFNNLTFKKNGLNKKVSQFGDRSEAVARSSDGVQVGIWPEFRLRVQRYYEHFGFCKLFGRKM